MDHRKGGLLSSPWSTARPLLCPVLWLEWAATSALRCIVRPLLLSPQFVFKHVNATSFQTCQYSQTFLSLLSLGLWDIVFCAFCFSPNSSIMYWFYLLSLRALRVLGECFSAWRCFPIYLRGLGHSQPCRSSGPKFLSVLNWLNGMPVSLLRV